MLLWIDGFEALGTSVGSAPSPAGVVARKYSVISGESGMDIETGRFSGYCLELDAAGCYIQPEALTTDATMIVGLAVNFNLFVNNPFLDFYDGATLGVNLRLTTDGELAVYRGTTLLGTTSGLGLSLDTWYYIELKVVCNDSGSYELRVDGSNVLSASGVDTKAGSNNYHTTFRCISPNTGSAQRVKIDDLYCLDGSGSLNNNFLGNMKVVILLPNANGDSSQFAPSSGDNYACVDETICNDDTDYVEDDTSAQKDLYNYEALSGNPPVIAGIQINTDCRETDANSFSLITPCKSGSTENDDTAQTVTSSTYITKRRILETDPNTSAAWTKTAIDAVQFGVKVG